MKQIYPISIQTGMSQSGSYILMLLEPESGRQIPLFIGQHEANSILIAKESVSTRRPLTHQLMLNTMEAYGISLLSVTIDRVLDGIFYATLHLHGPQGPHNLDCRPTDAITLALLAEAHILSEEQVIKETGVKVEDSEINNVNAEPSLEQLEQELERCEQNEEYERAAEIQKQIEQLRNSQ